MHGLLTSDLCGWPAEAITVLDDVPDPKTLALRLIADVHAAKDVRVLMVYYVGHGLRTMDSELALAVTDTDPHPEALPYTGVPYRNLANIMEASAAATKLVILDCCHAELANKANYKLQSSDTGESQPYGGLYFMGASKMAERAQAPLDGRPTYFTAALVDAVREGIPDEGEMLTAQQIFRVVNRQLLAARLAEPVDSSIRNARDLPLARNAAHGAALDHPLGTPAVRATMTVPPRHVLGRRRLVTAGTLVVAAAGTGWFGIRPLIHRVGAPSPLPPGSAVTQAKALGMPISGHTDMVTSVAFSPDGKTLASGSYDQTVRLWDIARPADPKPLGNPLRGHTNHVTSVAFSPDGRTLASASEDTTVRLWKIGPSRTVTPGTVLTGHSAAVNTVSFTRDGTLAASGSDDTTIRLWRLSGPGRASALGTPFSSAEGDMAAVVRSVCLSTSPGTLASGSGNATVCLWNINRVTAPSLWTAALPDGTGVVNAVALSPDMAVLAGAGFDQAIRLWEVSVPRRPATGPVLSGHTDAVTSLAFSPDSATLASTGYDRTIRLWDLTELADARPIGAPLTGHAQAIFCVTFNPAGTLLASASGDTTIRLWSLS